MEMLLPIASAAVFLLAILVGKALNRLPSYELRRRARRGQDAGLYRLASYGAAGNFIIGLLAVISLVVFADIFNSWWQIALIAVAAAWLTVAWHGPHPTGFLWRPSVKMASWLAQALNFLPWSSGGVLRRASHTGLYEKEDLLDLLQQQQHQSDSRIPEPELKAAASVLSFSGKKVSDCMTPISKAKLVSAADHIGPHLLDEMHKSSMDCFVVVKSGGQKSSKPDAVGALYLKDALEHSVGGAVKDAMTPGINEIDEDSSLIQALGIFLNEKCHVLVVKNGFNEVVGVLTLQEVLEQIFGKRQAIKKSAADKNVKLTSDEKPRPIKST